VQLGLSVFAAGEAAEGRFSLQRKKEKKLVPSTNYLGKDSIYPSPIHIVVPRTPLQYAVF
jgi:hypothetical protein